MSGFRLRREQIIGALREAVEPLPHVHAMWEGGAAAFGRVDEWSDIDVQIDVDDEQVTSVAALVERTLESLSPFTLKYILPSPTWHGHYQAFYVLQDAGPYLMVDAVVLKHSVPTKFLEPEIHGTAVVHFDKTGVTRVPPLDRAQFDATLQKRVETLRVTFPLFQSLTTKELERGNRIEALQFYLGYTLRPLVELLRIMHTPFHYNFHTRYLQYELAPEMVARLDALFYVRDTDDLRAKRQSAEQWFNTLMAQCDAQARAYN